MRSLYMLTFFLAVGPTRIFAQSEQTQTLVEQFTQAVQQFMEASDPCPYLPRVLDLAGRLRASDPDVARALEPMMQSISGETKESCEKGMNPEPDGPVDVSFRQGETRNLTDKELDLLRKGLHWSPPTAKLVVGGSADMLLKDRRETTLARVQLRWLKLEVPKAKPGTVFNPAIARVQIILENRSLCSFTSSMEIFADGKTAIDQFQWLEWTNLDHPWAGKTETLPVRSGEWHGNINTRAAELRPFPAVTPLSLCSTTSPPSQK